MRQNTYTAAPVDHPEVGYTTKRPPTPFKRTSKRATGPSTAGKLAVENSPAHPSAKNDHWSTDQEVIIMRGHTNPEPLEVLSTENPTVALCAKTKLEKEMERATAKTSFEIVNLELKSTMARKV